MGWYLAYNLGTVCMFEAAGCFVAILGDRGGWFQQTAPTCLRTTFDFDITGVRPDVSHRGRRFWATAVAEFKNRLPRYLVRAATSYSIILQLLNRLARQRHEDPAMFKARSTPHQWQVYGTVLDKRACLARSLLRAKTAAHLMHDPFGREKPLGPAAEQSRPFHQPTFSRAVSGSRFLLALYKSWRKAGKSSSSGLGIEP